MQLLFLTSLMSSHPCFIVCAHACVRTGAVGPDHTRGRGTAVEATHHGAEEGTYVRTCIHTCWCSAHR